MTTHHEAPAQPHSVLESLPCPLGGSVSIPIPEEPEHYVSAAEASSIESRETDLEGLTGYRYPSQVSFSPIITISSSADSDLLHPEGSVSGSGGLHYLDLTICAIC